MFSAMCLYWELNWTIRAEISRYKSTSPPQYVHDWRLLPVEFANYTVRLSGGMNELSGGRLRDWAEKQKVLGSSLDFGQNLEEMTGLLQSTAKVPLTKVPNPQMLRWTGNSSGVRHL